MVADELPQQLRGVKTEEPGGLGAGEVPVVEELPQELQLLSGDDLFQGLSGTFPADAV